MNKQELSVIFVKILKFYPRFYAEQKPEQVADNWFPYLKDNSFQVVDRAVDACICTMKFPPTIADVKAQIVESYLQDKPTAMQAFAMISDAVKRSYGKDDAAREYNKLPPILRKLVNSPDTLRDWNKVSAESFQTVIMSSIRESYKELTQREAKYYAFPADLQRAEKWRIEEPELAALPEPKRQKTVSEMLDEMDLSAVVYREKHGIKVNPEYQSKADAFKNPSPEELKMIEARLAEKLGNDRR